MNEGSVKYKGFEGYGLTLKALAGIVEEQLRMLRQAKREELRMKPKKPRC